MPGSVDPGVSRTLDASSPVDEKEEPREATAAIRLEHIVHRSVVVLTAELP